MSKELEALEHLKTIAERQTCDTKYVKKQAEIIRKTLREIYNLKKELGIEPLTLLNVLINGFYYKGEYGADDYGFAMPHSPLALHYNWRTKKYYFQPNEWNTLYFEDYGKTWALTKKELGLR